METQQRYGSADAAVTSCTINETLNGTPTATILYTQTGTAAQVRENAPAIGEALSPLYAPPSLGLVLIKRTFSDPQNGIVTVTLNYESREVGEDKPTYTMNATPKSIPLLSHPDFEKVPELAKAVAQEYINGKGDAATVWEKESTNDKGETVAEMRTGAPDANAADAADWKKTTLKKFVDKYTPLPANRIVRLARRGKKSMSAPSIKWKETKTTGSIPTIGRLGERSNPRGPHPSGFDWTITSITANEIARDEFGNKRYTVVTEWTSVSEAEA